MFPSILLLKRGPFFSGEEVIVNNHRPSRSSFQEGGLYNGSFTPKKIVKITWSEARACVVFVGSNEEGGEGGVT